MVPLKGWLLVAVIICMVVDGVVGQAVTTSAPIHVGILHSATGSMAAFESPLVQAELLAIDEINAAGGVLGRRVVPVIRDGASNLDTFVNEAKSLVSNASIATVFGCGSPACRIAVKPVFEASNTLLWHPIHHEGQDCSRSIMYTGATANQKIEPAIRFLINNYVGFSFVFVGMDEPYSRTVFVIAKEMLDAMGREVVGEVYLPAGGGDAALDGLVSTMRTRMPAGGIVLSTVNGEGSVGLFAKLQTAGLTAPRYAVMSFAISELDVPAIGLSRLMGHFLSANFLMTNPEATPTNDFDVLSLRFIQAFRTRYQNATAVLTDAMESAYTAVHLWAAAVDRALSLNTDLVRLVGYGAIVDAPQGSITLAPNNHIFKYARIGRMAPTGRFELVFLTQQALEPLPWNQFVPASRGFFCDHRRPRGERFSPPSINALFIYSSLIPATYEGQSVALFIFNQVSGGVNGRIIVPTYVNLDWPSQRLRQAVLTMSTTNGIDVVFGTAFNNNTWAHFNNTWSQLAAANETLTHTLIYVLPPFMPPCQKNIIYAGISPAVAAPVGLSFLKDRKIDSAFFIGEEADEGFRQVNAISARLLNSSLPSANNSGSCAISSNLALPNCLSQLQSIIFSTPSSSRPLIVNSISPYSPYFRILFDLVRAWSTQRSQIITILSTSAIDNSNLHPNMTSHFFLSSYYQEILTPENLVFKTNILTRAGPRTVISEPVEKAYSCIANIYAFGATRAKSVDSEAVRVSQWGSPTTAGSTITVNQNNQLSGVVRVGQAINVAGSMRYRVVFGDSPATRFTSSPTRGQGINEGEMCYFGPVTQIPSSWDPLRIVALVITIACMVMFAFLMAFVIYYRKMVVIRHSGLHFLMLTLSGCFINLFYIFIVFPVEKASWHCVAEFWPLHLGFITVFGALLQKVYAIFQSTQKRRFLKGNRQSQQTFWIQVISASIFFMLYMILRSVFQEDLIETFTTDLIPGVLVRKTWNCKNGMWDWAILGVEFLMVIIGIVMALQIRNVPSAFDESFHLGMAIYVWAFVKILNEVFLMFVPFDYQLVFGLKAFGEIIPCLHTATTFLGPHIKAIRAGKGNDLPRRISTSDTSADSDSVMSRQTSIRKDILSDPEASIRHASIRAVDADSDATAEGQPFIGKPGIPPPSSDISVSAGGTLTRKLTSARQAVRQAVDMKREGSNHDIPEKS